MQPARLDASVWCLVPTALLGMLVLAPPSPAQAVLETPQQASDVQADGDKGNTDRAGLTDAHFAAKFLDIENVHIENVAVPDDVVMRGHAHSGGGRPYAGVGL